MFRKKNGKFIKRNEKLFVIEVTANFISFDDKDFFSDLLHLN